METLSMGLRPALAGAAMGIKWILNCVSVLVFGGSTGKLTVITGDNQRHKCTSYRQFCSAIAEMYKDMAIVAIFSRF